jgi:uncharacterized protein (TIGR03083 family)
MLAPVDTRPLLAPLHAQLISLLEELDPDEWRRPTRAGAWTVREVAAHLLDGRLRRLSFHRDGHPLVPPDRPIAGFADLVAFLDGLNADWIRASFRLSPGVVLGLLSQAGREEAEFLASLPLEGDAFLPVAWAGQEHSPSWLDIGREYTELWHHQQQIREAVDRPLLEEPRWLGPVLQVSVYALPRAYAEVVAPEGISVLLEVDGPAGGRWALLRSGNRWELVEPSEPPTAKLRVPEQLAWRVLLKAVDPAEARAASRCEGEPELLEPFFAARAVMA